ncbi:MAG: 4a-hydroxytetrahydrobiopterin dehydratase [Patescibacteria group bacterium]
MDTLLNKKCVPCEGGVPPMTPEQSHQYLAQATGWTLDNSNKKISKELRLKNFRSAMALVNTIADLAEREGHHPDIHLSYATLRLELWTHSIGGLSENDFIMAAKINHLLAI